MSDKFEVWSIRHDKATTKTINRNNKNTKASIDSLMPDYDSLRRQCREDRPEMVLKTAKLCRWSNYGGYVNHQTDYNEMGIAVKLGLPVETFFALPVCLSLTRERSMCKRAIRWTHLKTEPFCLISKPFWVLIINACATNHIFKGLGRLM